MTTPEQDDPTASDLEPSSTDDAALAASQPRPRSGTSTASAATRSSSSSIPATATTTVKGSTAAPSTRTRSPRMARGPGERSRPPGVRRAQGGARRQTAHQGRLPDPDSRRDDQGHPVHLAHRGGRGQEAQIFLCIHLNSAASAKATGHVAYYYPGPIAGESRKLCTSISTSYKVIPPSSAGGVINEAYHIGLVKFGAPSPVKAATLIEVGFLSNDADRTTIATRTAQVAEEIAGGVAAYVEANLAALFASEAGLSIRSAQAEQEPSIARGLPQRLIPRARES